MVRGSKITAKVLLQRVQRPSGSAGASAAVPDSAVYDCAVRPRVTGNPQPVYKTQHPAPGSLRQLEGHMTQEEVCSSVSNHAESRKSCQKRTRHHRMLNIRQFLLLLWSFLQRWNLGCGFFWLLFALAKQKASDPQRISALINKKSAPLKIQELQLSDSAVYYSALRPTVTGSSRSAH
ncbi:hypothetical protein D4764_0217110 [Takifugu flavidus]|uniref:Uncharacterized protein n=1 Tax=Takifugu flavidus TaxID=433684 RepID=A0A5C6MES5_9TELE|nr:hypothetical protein D4764_0217110 [Takifugu flavidus]